MSIGSRLKEARISKKLTQTELASAVGITKGAIGNYETDVSSPKEEILIKLMKYLDIDANYLYQDFISADETISSLLKEDLSNLPGLYPEERQLLIAYRAADDITKSNIRKLLDLPANLKNTESSAI